MTSVAHGRCESCHAPNTPGWRVCPDCGHDRMADPRRDARVQMMAHAGRVLAAQWGHEPWSDSWSELVARTMLDALGKIDRALNTEERDGHA